MEEDIPDGSTTTIAERLTLTHTPRQTLNSSKPLFLVLHDDHHETIGNWCDLLNHLKNEGTREVNVQRYKGWAR